MNQQNILIVGGGHAAAQLCGSLVEKKFQGQVTLICEESHLPYQRPPLSKSFIKGTEEQPALIRAESWFAQSQIETLTNTRVDSIDRDNRRVRLANGDYLTYDTLVLATGTRARSLPWLPSDLTNVHSLRTADDAYRIRDAVSKCNEVTIIGAGFIGLELAATSNLLGKKVRVLELAPRILGRSLSKEFSDHVLEAHIKSGIQIDLNAQLGEVTFDNERITSLMINGIKTPIEELIVAIGAIPEESLALDAGIECENGILVDGFMRTSDPKILAIGDCTSFVMRDLENRLRLESIQNALDQAKVAASTIMGEKSNYHPFPWFWSEQGSMRLQMAGLLPRNVTDTIKRPGATEESFSLFHFVDDQLVCVESVNAPMDHMNAKKFLEKGINPSKSQISDIAFQLKSLI